MVIYDLTVEDTRMEDVRSSVLKMLQKRHPGYHPLMELATIALDDETDVRLKVDCHKTIVKYCEAELRSVEVRGEIKGDFGLLRVVIDNDITDVQDLNKMPILVDVGLSEDNTDGI